jgi:hypothetical protein
MLSLSSSRPNRWASHPTLRCSRYVSMDEDRCRVRAGAHALSGVRNAALGIIRRGKLAVREARENSREDRAEAIKPVTGRIL